MEEPSLRIDRFLWFARCCKSRALAQRLIGAGEVLLNGAVVERSSTGVAPGDRIELPAGRRLRRTIRVVALGTRRGPASEAASLFEEIGLAEPVER